MRSIVLNLGRIITGVEPVYQQSLSHTSQELAQILNTDIMKEKQPSTLSSELNVPINLIFRKDRHLAIT